MCRGFLVLMLFCLSFLFKANAQLEVGVSQVSSELCRMKVKGFSAVNVSQAGVSVRFYSNSHPIIFNNCNFIVIDKKKRDVLIYGGKVISSIGCESGNTSCNISFKRGRDGTVNAIYEDLETSYAKAEPNANYQNTNNVKNGANLKISQKSKSPLIVIDAGHGGTDPGAIGRRGTKEKDITLKYAKFIAKVLQNSGFRVYLTRENDEYLKLHERIDIAMKKNADFFISIHADSATNTKARGATIYTLAPQAVNEATKRTEARTNIGGNFVSNSEDEDLIFNILNIQHNSNVRQSFRFSEILVSSMKSQKIRFTSIPIRSADFAVLKAPTFPAILLEIGYLSNLEDEQMLHSKEYMEKIAYSIKDALKTP